MRGVWIAAFFALAFTSLGALFAWRATRIDVGWNPDRMVVDNSLVRREEEAIAAESRSVVPEWMIKMAESSEALRLPADEGAISWDLVDPEFRKNVSLILRFEKPDRFEKLCLERFFSSRQIAHKVEGSEFYDVRLALKDPLVANGLIKELAAYDLAATLITAEEPKPY